MTVEYAFLCYYVIKNFAEIEAGVWQTLQHDMIK